MFEIRKPKQKQFVLIRAASETELSNYEKHKLANIETGAQENKIETISIAIDGTKRQLEPLNKEIELELGSLACKSTVGPADLSSKDWFFIKCELDSTAIVED